MSAPEPVGTGVQITEDEAALYDRQIRLWGLEAQQKMRNAKIAIVRLNGTATEAVKNIVLSGIGELVIVDGDLVKEEDLGAGFFYRDEDVGKLRVDAAKARVESLNPLVTVTTVPTFDVLGDEGLEALIKSVDLVCVTDWDKDGLLRINEACRRLEKPFYAGGTYGLMGYIFCDLLEHAYISVDRSVPNEPPKNVKKTASYASLQVALRYRWTALTRREAKELNPAAVFTILAIWEYQSAHGGALPDGVEAVAELQTLADGLLQAAEVNKKAITSIPSEIIEPMATTAAHEFSPVCAVVGGMLAQDILKAMAAREPPIANFFTFEGSTGRGTVCKMSIQ